MGSCLRLWLRIRKENKGVRKLKNFVHNTSSHQQEIVEAKPKRTSSNIQGESANEKIAFVLQNKYYNSPNSLMASAQLSHPDNSGVSNAYRRSNASSTSANKISN